MKNLNIFQTDLKSCQNRMQTHLKLTDTQQREELNTKVSVQQPNKSPTLRSADRHWQTSRPQRNQTPGPDGPCSLFQDSPAPPPISSPHPHKEEETKLLHTNLHTAIERARGKPVARWVFDKPEHGKKTWRTMLFACLLRDPCVERGSWWMVNVRADEMQSLWTFPLPPPEPICG